MIAAAVLLAQYAGTFDALDTTRIGVRATQPPPIVAQGQIILAGDVSTTAAASLRLRTRRMEFSLTYAPTLSATDVELGLTNSVSVLQAGTVSVGWHDRVVRVTVSEMGAYGQLTAATPYQQAQGSGQASLPTTPAVPGQPTTSTQPTTPTPNQTLLLPPRTFDYGSSDTSATIGYAGVRRLYLSVSGTYHVSGGLGNDQVCVTTQGVVSCQPVLPEQYGPRGTVTASYPLSATDGVGFSASAQDTVTPYGACPGALPTQPALGCRQETPVAQAGVSWTHRLSETATLTSSAGASATELWTTTVPITKELAIVPALGVTLSGSLGGRATGTLSAQLGPTIDVRTGLASTRLTLSGSLSEQVAPRVVMSATAGFMQSINFPNDDPDPVTSLSGGVNLAYRVDRQVDVTAGVTAFWQEQTGVAGSALLPLGLSEVGYVSVTARAPTLHF